MSATRGYRHWTETHKAVLDLIRRTLGIRKIVRQKSGADLAAEGYNVEVKSCSLHTATNFANGTRRKGRFRIHNYELDPGSANPPTHFVFVVHDRRTILRMTMMDRTDVEHIASRPNATIPWSKIFPRDPALTAVA